jgi:hypothetical protein
VFRREDLDDLAWLERHLREAGIPTETAWGRSDDGSAWAVICDTRDGETLVHVAQIDGSWVVATSPLESALHGQRLRPLLESVLQRLKQVVA